MSQSQNELMQNVWASIVLLMRIIWTCIQECSFRIFIGLPTILTDGLLSQSACHSLQTVVEAGNNQLLPKPLTHSPFMIIFKSHSKLHQLLILNSVVNKKLTKQCIADLLSVSLLESDLSTLSRGYRLWVTDSHIRIRIISQLNPLWITQPSY